MTEIAKLAAVTGASGFIGQHITQAFAESGWRLRALSRQAAGGDRSRDIEWVKGDLQDENTLARLVEGADVVINCAGAIKARRDRDFMTVNTEGLIRLARVVIAQVPEAHFIHMSSLAAREPHLSAYAHSKFEGERHLQALNDRLNWTILRPPAVYGPGDREILKLFQMVGKGLSILPRRIDPRISLIHVHDLASATLFIAKANASFHKTLEISDQTEQGYSLEEILQLMADLQGTRPIAIRIPLPLASGIAALNQFSQRLLAREPIFTPGKVREFFHPDWRSAEAKSTLFADWKPRYNARSGFAETYKWYKSQGLI